MEKDGICLLATTGMPYSGKSELARHLSSEYGFARLNTDDTRKVVFGKNFEQLEEYEEMLIVPMLLACRDTALYNGFNVAMDSCALYNEVRSNMLRLPQEMEEYLKARELPVAKYLVALRSDRKRLIERGMKREGISLDEAERRLSLVEKHWEEIDVGKDVIIVEYENNRPGDIGLIKDDVSRKIKPYTGRLKA